jgi:hypothetical protein
MIGIHKEKKWPISYGNSSAPRMQKKNITADKHFSNLEHRYIDY